MIAAAPKFADTIFLPAKREVKSEEYQGCNHGLLEDRKLDF